MKKDTSDRLKELLSTYGVSQEEFSRRTGIPKSSLSMYISGQRKPKQDRLSDIAEAFNVSEAWLMGFEVEQDRVPAKEKAKIDFELINKFHKLNSSQQTIVMQLIDQLIQGGD